MASHPHFDTVDLSLVRKTLQIALDRAEELDARPMPDHALTRDRSAAIAEIAKELLFLKHLCDKAGVCVMDEYQATRGYTDHLG